MIKMELWAALPCLLLVSPLAGQEPPAPSTTSEEIQPASHRSPAHDKR